MKSRVTLETNRRADAEFGHLGLLNRQLGGKLVPAMKKIPRSIAIKLNPASLGVAGFYKVRPCHSSMPASFD